MERKYIIFSTSELSKIDFSQVLETSDETLRRSVNGEKTFVKWEAVEPSFLNDLVTKEGPYTHDQILDILNTSEWVSSNPFFY